MWYHHLSRILHTALSGPDRLVPLARLRARPLRIEIDVNNHCNLHCPHCLRNWSKVPMNQNQLGVADLQKLGPWFDSAHMVRLGGTGEPFLHPEICELIGLVQSHGAPVCVITNCTRITEPIARRLCTKQPLLLNLSVDAATPEIFEKVRLGAKFNEVVANIDRLVAIKRETGSIFPILNINMTLMRETLGEVGAVVELARRWQAPVINAQTVIFFDGSVDHPSSVTNQEARAAVEQALPLARQYGIEIRFVPLASSFGTLVEEESAGDAPTSRHPYFNHSKAGSGSGRFYCPMLWHHLWVDVLGNIRPCCMGDFGPVGNLRDMKPEELWNHPKMVALRRKLVVGDPPPECRECSMLEQFSRRKMLKMWKGEWPNIKNIF